MSQKFGIDPATPKVAAYFKSGQNCHLATYTKVKSALLLVPKGSIKLTRIYTPAIVVGTITTLHAPSLKVILFDFAKKLTGNFRHIDKSPSNYYF